MKVRVRLSGGLWSGLVVELDPGGLTTARVARDLHIHEARPIWRPTYDRYQLAGDQATWLETVFGTIDDWLESTLLEGPADGLHVWCAGPLSCIRWRTGPTGPLNLYLAMPDRPGHFIWDGLLPPSGGPG